MAAEKQITDQIIMIRPAAFGFNVETAASNTFQQQSDDELVSTRALAEFDNMVATLRKEGVDVTVIEDMPVPQKPDAVFPNNWISFHADGTLVTYPMQSALRRLERRDDIIHVLTKDYRLTQHIAFEGNEAVHAYLEGTGSLVLDRVNRIAYACISPRTDERVLQEWCEKMNYTSFTFHASYAGQAIYHTNVMMAIGDGIAVVGLTVVEQGKQKALQQSLEKTGHVLVLLTPDQIGAFAGNMLGVHNAKGEQLMVMSATAHHSLTESQLHQIGQFARIVVVDVSTIEHVGGGSVRCMMAENFLPPM